MNRLEDKRVIVGVTGGIAAYKSAELVRRLRDAGVQTRVVMTRAAARFITPLTLQAVSGQPVHRHLLSDESESAMGHIELARWADWIVIAPASAHTLAKLAHGLADDLLSTLCLATRARIALAPSMNRVMWDNPATQRNVQALAKTGAVVLGPDSGAQACGETGPGRMLEPAEIVAALDALEGGGVLDGVRVVITAGPTFEAIDPVRVLGNRSSGKMGYAIAAAAQEAGARVVLVSGPTALSAPRGVHAVPVTSAHEMLAAVEREGADAEIFIGCAAVSDYRPLAPATHKIKKDAERLTLELVRNPDILARVAARTPPPFTVGFAAETDDLEANARAKLAAKGIDLICANRVGEGLGIEVDDNALTLIDRHGIERLPLLHKRHLARALIQHVARRFHAKNPTAHPRSAHRH